jgi:hypothetical protein
MSRGRAKAQRRLERASDPGSYAEHIEDICGCDRTGDACRPIAIIDCDGTDFGQAECGEHARTVTEMKVRRNRLTDALEPARKVG